MSDRTTGYAQAIVAMAEGEGSLDVVENELLTLARAIDDNPDVREALTDIQRPAADRLRFVEAEALTAAHPTTRGALAMLIAADRVSEVAEIAQEVSRRAAEARDRELAEVYVAVDLDEPTRDQLRTALERATGKKLEMKVFVDESVVGGVRAKIGDTVIDGSLARRLDDIRTRIVR